MSLPGLKASVELADNAPHILVVDDDRRVRELLTRFLYEQGFRVTAAANVAEARTKAQCFVFDALVLDVMMPGESGFDYARHVRETSRVPILMLTARSNPNDRVMGLEIGADDYLPKPFEPRELILRLNNIIKRRAEGAPAREPGLETVTFGPFSYRIDRGELRRADETIRITEREREILTVLAQAGGANVEREALAGAGGLAAERSIDVQINRLRRKTEVDPANPLFLQTVRGVGYRLAVD
ncbi:two-component system response regulator [Methylobacterium sp. Leaf469]|jgi:two-component system phosphate regulon response regulator OmpR|uniref:response regulator n=1 Tax=unclassified Methylobacterium TaxID=2615210 RepID=UPI0006FEF027|nr:MULTISPECIES: response regulator [unclassified Methylobacterium]USU30969.1 response regulator [Methylobacterium sp. OTU13CASTA1]KQO71254.1 two-component system response regulator [Methylobacterium sp. Leaf87]KQP24662.1 two-component system response regulator [Methylobacterium sp. Leaf102]KQP36042.1 two-component system response regulator [Methylobacterium sp. Leaf100]KQP60457.1 two-component system response regulator [Methylobacterium sp. Leaf112]